VGLGAKRTLIIAFSFLKTRALKGAAAESFFYVILFLILKIKTAGLSRRPRIF